MMMLRRGLGTLRGGRCSQSIIFRSFSSSSTVSCGGVADVAADYLLASAAPAAKVEMEPTLLQPGVVIYDGVCHLCHGGVKWVIGADKAALKVLSYLPLPYSALSTLMIVPAPLRDAVYDYVAKRRYDWFGKSDDCLVLREKELLERFIDRDEMLDRDQSKL